MNIQKLLLATVASFIVMFGLGFLWHMILMHDWYVAHAGVLGDISREAHGGQANIMFIAAGCFLLSLMMSYIYPKGVESDNKIMEGLKFGIIMGIIAFLPLEMILHGVTFIFSKQALLMDAVWNTINAGISGIIIALVYGDTVKVK